MGVNVIVPLRTPGEFALLSSEDVEFFSGWNLYKSTRGYLIGYPKDKSAEGLFRISRVIYRRMGNTNIDEVDHKDGNPSNNTRENLRGATRSQNQMNRVKVEGTSSKYKGVYFCNFTGKWRARIKKDGTIYNLGRYENEDDAGMAYDNAAILKFGQYAKLNFP